MSGGVKPGQASHVVVASPNKPRPDDLWALAIADSLRRTEINYHREGSGPGSRFEGELLEDVQARVAISMMRARQAEESAISGRQPAPGPADPPSEEAPVYAKVKQDFGARSSLWMITVDEGWRSTILCSGMYEADADFLLSVLGRTPRAVKP